MDVRLLELQDYDNTLTKWWSDWKWEAPSIDFLPGNGTSGVMVSEDGVDICAGFIYLTNSKCAWCEFIVSNFHFKDKEKRKEAMLLLITSLTGIAEDKGCKYVYTLLKNKSLISHYKTCGYQEGSKNCLEMVKII
jgi:hypothetical protein